LIRLWHTGETSKNILKKLKRRWAGAPSSDGLFEEIPANIRKTAKRWILLVGVFKIFGKIWPEMERLTREDLADERLAADG